MAFLEGPRDSIWLFRWKNIQGRSRLLSWMYPLPRTSRGNGVLVNLWKNRLSRYTNASMYTDSPWASAGPRARIKTKTVKTGLMTITKYDDAELRRRLTQTHQRTTPERRYPLIKIGLSVRGLNQ